VGGMSGFAIVIDKVVPLEFVTVDLLITVMTWSLFLVGFLILGKNFALKTLISTVIYPPFITLFSKLTSPDVLDGVFCLKNSPHGDIVLLISALFGGVLIGFGCALTFIGGGSTRGTDIIAFTICKFIKRIRSSVVIFITDSLSFFFVFIEIISKLLKIADVSLLRLVKGSFFICYHN
jgi:uncharacterized membrane-anchored protein YitT (DUF2179 family)